MTSAIWTLTFNFFKLMKAIYSIVCVWMVWIHIVLYDLTYIDRLDLLSTSIVYLFVVYQIVKVKE